MVVMVDVIDSLQDGQVFTTLESVSNGFFHVPVDSEYRNFTAFVTHNGQYHFLDLIIPAIYEMEGIENFIEVLEVSESCGLKIK